MQSRGRVTVNPRMYPSGYIPPVPRIPEQHLCSSAPISPPVSIDSPAFANSPTLRTSSSFRVSASGSPRYTPRTDSPRLSNSSMAPSRIPRKSPGSTTMGTTFASPPQTTVAPRPRSRLCHRADQGLTNDAPTSHDILSSTSSAEQLEAAALGRPNGRFVPAINAARPSPPANSDKPLPSPPAMDVVNSTSPPRAQRTLIDAEVAGRPSPEQWPAIAPEIVDHRNSTNSAVFGAPCISTAHNSTHNKQMLTIDASTDLGIQVPTSPHESEFNAISVSPYDGDDQPMFHAITTPNEEALESPLAQKLARESSQMLSAVGITAISRRKMKGSKPTLPEGFEGYESNPNEDHRDGSHESPESMGDYTMFPRISQDLASVYSETADSSFYNDDSQISNCTYRTKHLHVSEGSSRAGLNPILNIYGETETLLFKDKERRRTSVGSKTSQLQSLGKRTMSRLSSSMSSKSGASQTRATRLPMRTELRSSSISLLNPTTHESNVAIHKRSSLNTPREVQYRRAKASTLAEILSRSKTSPALASPSPQTMASVGYPSSLASLQSSRLGFTPGSAELDLSVEGMSYHQRGSLSNQRAILRKPAKTSQQSDEFKTSQKIHAGGKMNKITHAKEEKSAAEQENKVMTMKEENSALEQKDKTTSMKEDKSTLEKKVKAKRSFRDILRRNNKDKTPTVVPGRFSLGGGNTFSSRLKNSVTNASKNNQKVMEETVRRPASKGMTRADRRVPSKAADKSEKRPSPKAGPKTEQVTASKTANKSEQRPYLKAGPKTEQVTASKAASKQGLRPSPQAETKTEQVLVPNAAKMPDIHAEASSSSETVIRSSAASKLADQVHEVIARVRSLAPDSAEAKRGEEIAEVLAAASEACNQSQIACAQSQKAAVEASKWANQAGYQANLAGLHTNRLFQLCERNLEPRTMEAIKAVIRKEYVNVPEPSSLALRSASNPQ